MSAVLQMKAFNIVALMIVYAMYTSKKSLYTFWSGSLSVNDLLQRSAQLHMVTVESCPVQPQSYLFATEQLWIRRPVQMNIA